MNERKFINEAVKKLLVSEYIRKETENAGFGGMEMKRTPFGTNITLFVNKPGLVIGRHGSKVQQITENLEKKYKIESPQIEVKEINNPDLNPQVVSKKIALSLEKGWAYRKAGNTSLRRIVESGARGVIISISGKLSGERGRMQKFMSGSVKYSGEPARAGMQRGFSIAKIKLGVIGVKVGILNDKYKLPDDYMVSEKLGVVTPQLIQKEETAEKREAVKQEEPRRKPRARRGEQEPVRKETPADRKPRPVVEKRTLKKEAEEEKKEEPQEKAEPRRGRRKVPEKKEEATQGKTEAGESVIEEKAEVEKPEEKQEAKPETENIPPAVDEEKTKEVKGNGTEGETAERNE